MLKPSLPGPTPGFWLSRSGAGPGEGAILTQSWVMVMLMLPGRDPTLRTASIMVEEQPALSRSTQVEITY